MSNFAVMPLNDYVETCEAIREKTGNTENIKSGEMVEKINAVFEAGKQSEYDRFWDSYQNYGKLTWYARVFAGGGWNDETFKPKYDIKPVHADSTFQGAIISNLKNSLKQQGVVLDTSKCTSVLNMFFESKTAEIPTISLKSAKAITYLFYNCPNLVTIEKLIMPDNDETLSHAGMFNICSKLENIVFEGTIAVSTSLAQSPLSKESILSCFAALSNTSSGQTLSIKKTAKESAFTDEEWAALIATKPNWQFALV